MKKKIALLLILTAITLIFTGCGKAGNSKTLKVGASITPHAEILKVAGEILAEQGYTLEIVEYDDYVLPNTATQSGELIANYFQHEPYLIDFNKENKTDLVSVAAIHYEPFGIYPGKTKSLDKLADGATIAIPNDGTNEARALYLLEAQGLIKLKEGIGFTATILDIESNPKNLVIKELAAAQIPRALEDVDLGIINGNYAIQAGLNVEKDALAYEDKDSESAQTYANIIAVKKGNENNEGIQALIKAIKSEKVKSFIKETYGGSVIPLF